MNSVQVLPGHSFTLYSQFNCTLKLARCRAPLMGQGKRCHFPRWEVCYKPRGMDPVPSRWCQQKLTLGSRPAPQLGGSLRGWQGGTHTLCNGWPARRPIVWSSTWILMWGGMLKSLSHYSFFMSVVAYRICSCPSTRTPLGGAGHLSSLGNDKPDAVITLKLWKSL